MDSLAASLPALPEGVPVGCGTALAGLTSLGVGGPAAWLLRPRTPGELARCLQALAAAGRLWRVLGGGANTLAPDGGFPGAVLHTGALRQVVREPGNRLRLAAGVPLPGLLREAAAAGLSGLEFLAGVPGHVGGALAMNAGSATRGIWDLVEEVDLWLPPTAPGERGTVVRRGRDEMSPAYRDGGLEGAVVLAARLRLHPARPPVVRRRMAELLARKRRTQPVTAASAGCAFRNPPGESAGRLLDAAGCKGLHCGGAVVSERHANFVLNAGGARAADVRRLLERMAAAVAERFGIVLERELVVWPEPDPGSQPAGGASRQG